MSLKLDWVGQDALDYACRHWHYSRSVPASRKMALGVWEDDAFKGVVIFSHGATPQIGAPYGLKQDEVCELTRIALAKHRTPVSRIVAISLRMITQRAPGLRLVVSYAAQEQGHHGGIYQAGGWVYEGAAESFGLKVKGRVKHARSISSKFGRADMDWIKANIDPEAERVNGLIRHKYLMALDNEMKAQITPLAKAYPKRSNSA